MFIENEFGLLKDTLEKCGLAVTSVAPDNTFSNAIDDNAYFEFKSMFHSALSFDDLLGGVKPNTLYKYKDSFLLNYLAFLLPKSTGRIVIVIGPFLTEGPNENQILEICEQNGFEPKNQRTINEFFFGLPVIPADSQIHILLDSFCERMWDGQYEISEITNDTEITLSVLDKISARTLEDTFLDMKNMERRYAFENELMDAVSLGSESKLVRIFSATNDAFYEKRAADPVRNSKNYGVIMNTLLRKAAERGGVHPMYLDKISSDFAIRIEAFSSIEQGNALMREMFVSYCKLVRKQRSAAYSPLVKSAVTAIDADLSAELNLSSLAKQLNVSNVYLSSIFKKETGTTLTDYINQRRVSYAKYLLSSTSLQIQTISIHCGIADVHYFSKLFKQRTGKTPSQYRVEAKSMK